MNKLWAAMIVPMVGIFGAATSVYADSTLVTVNISDTSLELDVPASPTILTLNPTASGANFGSVDLTATVGTNNPTGYQLSVTFSNTSLARTVAIDGTTPTINTLDDLTGGYPVADFTVNRWGHKITGDNYFPVPSNTLSPESWSSDEPVNNAPNVITLAAKADGTIPSGIYETTLTYTLVANPGNVTFDDAFSAASKTKDITTDKYKMQDMNASICDMVTTPTASDYSDTPETQLVDIRDGKVYWVAKLMDGKCWMTQNLDLDLETTPDHVLALTSENTDLNTFDSNGYDTSNGYSKDANDVITWTPERDTIPTSSISSTGSISGWSWTDDYNNPYSIDTGDWYWIGNWKNNGTDTWYAYTTNNYLNTDGSGAGDKFSTSEYTGNGKHGHVGNYYNWPATIASNNSSSYNAYTLADITTNPQNSICPSGWRLPTVSNASDTENEFRRLVTLYGNTTGNDKALTAAPLWFVRGGYVYGSSLYDSGYGGDYWSSTVYDSSYAYFLYFYSGGGSPAYYGSRHNGRSVRCIAR